MLSAKDFGNTPPEPKEFHKFFHELFRVHPNANRKKLEWKKKKKNLKGNLKNKNKMNLANDSDYVPPPLVEVPLNASSFAMFAFVRMSVLERWFHYANHQYLQSSSCVPIDQPVDVNEDVSSDQYSAYENVHTHIMPRVVGIGLQSVFELIKESRHTHPGLCTKALNALYNVLQAQSPEHLKEESKEVIESLFELLQDLATLHGPESSVPNDGSHLTALACACLLSLVVARGDTGKFLSATASLIMCPRALATQNIKMPTVLADLQRSVQSVFFGEMLKTDYFLFGVPVYSRMLSFNVSMPSGLDRFLLEFESLTCDGHFLYLFTNRGLFKVGTGYGGTLKGHVYVHKPDFFPQSPGTLVYCDGKLYLKLKNIKEQECLIIDSDSLSISDVLPLHAKDAKASVFFSNGESLGTISPARDDGFTVRILDKNTIPAALQTEVHLDLARKCVEVFGTAPFEEDNVSSSEQIKIDDEEIASIHAGKEFGLLRTVSGKVFYFGKASALGLKQPGPGNGKWKELPMPKQIEIKQISIGHDGLHAVLLSKDNKPYFVGMSRRGEDGDLSKIRRQPKPSKLKKLACLETSITYVACNSGTTAVVSLGGYLRMYGKDATHTDEYGGIKNMENQVVKQIALGKAHGVVLCNGGHVYTFGINNKFQCGRDFMPPNKEECPETVITMETCGTHDELDVYNDLEDVKEELRNLPCGLDGNESDGGFLRRQMCPPNKHTWYFRQCMICTVCNQCTGFSDRCRIADLPGREPGRECGCGDGSSGCALCGCCQECSQLQLIDNGVEPVNNEVAADNRQTDANRERLAVKYLQAEIKRRMLAGGKQSGKPKSSRGSSRGSSSGTPSPVHRANTLKQANALPAKDVTEVERDTARVASLAPSKIYIPDDVPVIQVACGLHHTVMLMQNGQVCTFGSNQYGQLGCGDILAKVSLQIVNHPGPAILVAAGSNHTIILTARGEVVTFGAYQKGQLGRPPPAYLADASQPGGSNTSKLYQNPRRPWHSFPHSIPNIGPRTGRKATWIGGSGDQTFIKIDECLISSSGLSDSTVMADKNTIVITPKVETEPSRFKCLAIHPLDGECVSFKGDEQVDFRSKLVCLDTIYNVMWAYDPTSNQIDEYNVVAKDLLRKNNIQTEDGKTLIDVITVSPEIDEKDLKVKIPLVISPELALPLVSNCQVSRIQAAVNLLCCMDTLTSMWKMQFNYDIEQLVTHGDINKFSREDFQPVNRFESNGGGWGYSGHSVEAIRFMADTDVILGGIGLFGGRGEYTAKMRLYDLGPDGGEQEGDGELLRQMDEIPYDCAPRQKHHVLFEAAVPLQAHRWYVVCCQISGPSSDCGSSGQTMVTTEDQVVFYFKSSKKSNNGTDVNAGQIPQLLYRIITPEIKPPRIKTTGLYEKSKPLSNDFSRTVSSECFQSLQSLLQWAWNTFKRGVLEAPYQTYTSLEMERLVYVCRASLRLLKTYTLEVYPDKISSQKKTCQESVELVGRVSDVRALLRQILSDNLPILVQGKRLGKVKPRCEWSIIFMNSILEECHNTFVSCFHAFYPTAYLKWSCLCELLFDIENEAHVPGARSSQRLLSAVLRALCGPTVRLRNSFPLLSWNMSLENSLLKELNPCDNNGEPMLNAGVHYYPVLVEHMTYRSQVDSGVEHFFSWKDALERLLSLICEPVQKELSGNKGLVTLPSLTKNCCLLLARVTSELVIQCTRDEEDFYCVYGRSYHSTTPRFARINQSRTWNTGNGAPEAICFQVDRPGISFQGVGVYGGVGRYDYEIEFFEEQNVMGEGEGQHGHTQRWKSMQSTKGIFEASDFNSEIVDIMFPRHIPLVENVKYAIRFKNYGGKSFNGDGGLPSVKGSDNTTFTFSTCSLSLNGTTVSRGQIPIIYYYSNPLETAKATSHMLEEQAKERVMSMTFSILEKSCNLLALARERADEVLSVEILNNSSIVQILLPMVMGHMSLLAHSDPKCAAEILNQIKDLLPHVAALNLMAGASDTEVSLTNMDIDALTNTTSQHYAYVQSDHPYKPASVLNYRVKFPETVRWMSIEFDPNCSTVQPEDTLQLYVPSTSYPEGHEFCNDADYKDAPYWPVLNRYSASAPFPQNAAILPGREVLFSLETASDYLKDERASAYGFRCMVVGYEWPTNCLNTALKNLEAELAFLGGSCATNLIKKDLNLLNLSEQSDDEEMEETADIIAKLSLANHGSLLSKGLALTSPPTINQALEGPLPFSAHSNERMFLRDFVNCIDGTSGGRLAQWLQPASRLDPSKCHIMFSKEQFRCGWPAMITVLTCDQYSDVVFVNYVQVEVKAIPIDKKDLGNSDAARKIRRVSEPDPLAFGGLPAPTLSHPYEPTIRDKMCFHSISIMKPYQNYSFEELRYTSPPIRRASENMLVSPNGDGSYTATWTPASIGCYSIVITIDGYEMEEVFKVEVKEPPQGVTPPTQNLVKKSPHQPNKLRKFVAKNSAGLRIRALPCLQSEQLGIVHVNGTIAFIDEVHNNDGVWLRLSADTMKQYGCIASGEAWCLQYNKHLGKTLLLPVEEPKSTLDPVITDPPETVERRYQVIKSGASGHNVRTGPSLDAPSIGVLVLGSIISVSDYVVNKDGCWVLLDDATKRRYCFNADFEAWSLAIGENNKLYLGNVSNAENDEFSPKLPPDTDLLRIFTSKGYNFNQTQHTPENPFISYVQQPSLTPVADRPSSTNPFVFGNNCAIRPESPRVSRRERKDSAKLIGLPKWFKEETKSDGSEFSNVSVKELVKAIGESRANGNGVTPPGTPKRSCSPRAGRFSPKPMSRSSSPIGVPVSGIGHESSARRGSNQSDTSALVSSITRDLSQSPSQATQPRDLSPSPSGSSLHTRSENVEQSPRVLAQTGTQTSPENGTNNSAEVPSSVKAHFSIGAVHKEEKLSPKLCKKDRSMGAKPRGKRSISPSKGTSVAPQGKVNYPTNQPVKESMSPSVAESLRAIFAAFLWHEGIVHDAMACASYLKFHPSLPKKGTTVVTRHGHSESLVDKRRQELSKEERARQRHSVEVANAGNYLHIQPSTLESLTRSAANANANRCRNRRVDAAIKEDTTADGVIGGYQTVSVLPPALKCLVFLWEHIVIHSCNTMAIATNVCMLSHVAVPENRKRRARGAVPPNKVDCEEKKKTVSFLKSRKGLNHKVLCGLCGTKADEPITKHMKECHPGCGFPSGGAAFKPDGRYVLDGFAGNCGSEEGDAYVPRDWYLMCENCRNKYLAEKRPTSSDPAPAKYQPHSDYSQPHIVMRNNAMFLLELASAAENTVNRHQRRSSASPMPSVSENHSPPDSASIFTPVPPFQCLQALGADDHSQESELYEQVLRLQDGAVIGTVNIGQRPLSEISLSDDTDGSKGTRFHRSVSMGTNGVPWSKAGLDGRVIMMRRRNNSNTETSDDGASSLLCKPSPALLRLVPNMDGSSIVPTDHQDPTHDSNDPQANTNYLMERPVMEFILIPQDLDKLQFGMRLGIRKAAVRAYAMQALIWLLRSVTQPVCLHDLLWWFVTSLQPYFPTIQRAENNKAGEETMSTKNFDDRVCEHPLSDLTIAGDAVHPLTNAFHTLLQTISDLMVLLPMGSALQQMAVRCWGIKFTTADHTFLHRSQVFSNISKILSRSEEIEDNTVSMHESIVNQVNYCVDSFKDLTSFVEIKASSRLAMVGSLTDGSTETFWESGDEDRHVVKTLIIHCAPGHVPKLVCAHVDNVRDLNNRIRLIVFYAGHNSEHMDKLREIIVDEDCAGWIKCPILYPKHSVIKLELKSIDTYVRIRQICVLGQIEGESLKIGRQHSAMTVQQKNCESETLRVFRLITSEVFGKLILGDQDGQHLNNLDSGSVSASESMDPLEESNDLREHMVGILFSRSKLTHLQKQVIVHIVYAIKKESIKAKEEWEMMLCSVTEISASSEQSQDQTKSSDTYCFEMLSMVLALSGSAVGRAYLSQQGGLLADLLSLLHTGSARVQRQVTSLLRRMLPEITPEALAAVTNVDTMPPSDFNIVSATNKESGSCHFDTNKIGILDVFLSVIAKSLTIQVKFKGKANNGASGKEINTTTLSSCIHPEDKTGKRWWLRGTVSRKLSEVIVHLIKDMASGKLSDTWANVTKAAIAQNILNLTQLNEKQKESMTCLQTPTLWMALASLCVLDKDHVERLSSGQWSQENGQPPGPTCTNHDDGETSAVVQCSVCGNLCTDCDRILHLPRWNKHHQRRVCKEEEEAIRVDLHEGCGRMKLFWLLALADARTLKALVEFREGGPILRAIGPSGQCRFCGALGTSGLLAIGNVCADQECQDYALTACQKLLPCGHMCGGVQGEVKCLPCLHGCASDPSLRQDADDMCMICFTEALSCAPAIQLHCGHVFHSHCCNAVLTKRWVGPRITFSFALCPICKVDIDHPVLDDLLCPIRELYKDVRKKALMRLEYEGLHTSEPIVTTGGRFFNDPAGYALDRYAYYVCFKCKKSYYGGEARCDAEIGENYDPAELICGACSDVTRASVCQKHGTDFLEYKCRYCCSVAVFFCFGTTHFCNPCHDDFQRVTTMPKHQLPHCPAGPRGRQLEGDECPLHVQHPPTGEEFALGCGVCRNAQTF